MSRIRKRISRRGWRKRISLSGRSMNGNKAIGRVGGRGGGGGRRRGGGRKRGGRGGEGGVRDE